MRKNVTYPKAIIVVWLTKIQQYLSMLRHMNNEITVKKHSAGAGKKNQHATNACMLIFHYSKIINTFTNSFHQLCSCPIVNILENDRETVYSAVITALVVFW